MRISKQTKIAVISATSTFVVVAVIFLIFFNNGSARAWAARSTPTVKPSASVTATSTDPTFQPSTASADPSEDPSVSATAGSVYTAPPVIQNVNPFSLKGLFTKAILPATADAGQSYLDKIVFVGDSTTYGFKAFGYIGPNNVWVPENGTLALDRASTDLILYSETNENITIVEAARRKQPGIMVITLGVNGVAYLSPASIKDYYGSLVDGIKNVSPNTKIILQSVFPVATNYELLNYINNNNINEANYAIAEMAEQKGLKFLNTAESLKDATGNLRDDLDSGDGMHLYYDGYDIVMKYIRTHALFN